MIDKVNYIVSYICSSAYFKCPENELLKCIAKCGALTSVANDKKYKCMAVAMKLMVFMVKTLNVLREMTVIRSIQLSSYYLIWSESSERSWDQVLLFFRGGKNRWVS